MGKYRRKLPRLIYDRPNGNEVGVRVKVSRHDEGMLIPTIEPSWSKLEQQLQAPISEKQRAFIKWSLRNYAEGRAGEEYARSWSDKNNDDALLNRADKISKAAQRLFDELNDNRPATNYFLERVELVVDQYMWGQGDRFSRDDFTPLLKALVANSEAVRERLAADYARPTKPGARGCWLCFVSHMAGIYLQITGDAPVHWEISERNSASKSGTAISQSRFARFAFEAMMQIPPELREKGQRQGLVGFTRALREPLQEWRARELKEKNSANPR